MENGDCVRMTSAFKSSYKDSAEDAALVEELGSCTGVVQEPRPGGSSLKVRWHPSNKCYRYNPNELEVAIPATYFEDFVPDPARSFALLRDELEWDRRGDTPRHEYYCNDFPEVYMYGKGKGRRAYDPRPYHPEIIAIRTALEKVTGTTFEVCFLNRYLDQSDQLGWHADDSPEMDDGRPIAVVSLGVAREIWFREKPEALVVAGEDQREGQDRRWSDRQMPPRRTEPVPNSKLLLASGSLCLMAPGMQNTHQHRIPKASFKCGERISLTFRGYVRQG